MEYAAFYRKLRPKTFEDVVGQTAIVKTLKNQIIGGRVSHAYLFCGTRGTGKTSAAKIFARALNCENPQNGSPCNVCASCAAILNDQSGNVVEMDAASNNGVDDVRALNEAVRYAPADGLRKVYIVDEVHMMTGGAFNALLKTLEEPPPYVVFILATTDPQKLPATILSRVQRYDFARISRADMFAALSKYMKDEGVDITDEALAYIVSRSDGAMRDALSALDQCVSYYYGETVTMDKLLDALGATDPSVFFGLSSAIDGRDAAAVLSIIEGAHSLGRDMTRFMGDFLSFCRDLVLCGANPSAYGNGGEYGEKLTAASKAADHEQILYRIDATSKYLADSRHYPNPRLAAEVCFVSLCRDPVQAPVSAPSAAPARAEVQTKPKAESEAPPVKKSVPEDVLRVKSDWLGFCAAMPQPEKGYLASSEIRSLGDDRLVICAGSVTAAQQLKKMGQGLNDALKARYGAEFNVQVMSRTLFDAQHKTAFGQIDNFDYDAAIGALTEKLGEISIED